MPLGTISSHLLREEEAPDHELFYAPQQAGMLPTEGQEKGVQTTTSFLEVSICKTPKEDQKRSRNIPHHSLA